MTSPTVAVPIARLLTPPAGVVAWQAALGLMVSFRQAAPAAPQPPPMADADVPRLIEKLNVQKLPTGWSPCGSRGWTIEVANLSAELRKCLEQAEDCAERAKTESVSTIQRHFIELERRRLKLARSYQLFERLETFSAHQRGELSNRLEQLKLANGRRSFFLECVAAGQH
jgi:hypothetical protein